MLRLLRHSQSRFNVDPTQSHPQIRDCGLTSLGIQQSSHLTGHYDAIIMSPLQRANQTLSHSKITYDHIITTPLARECRFDMCDFLTTEPFIKETHVECLTRATLLKEFLILQSQTHQNILLIAHRDIIWYLTSHTLKNAESIEYDLFYNPQKN